jgi:hypothetical protein
MTNTGVLSSRKLKWITRIDKSLIYKRLDLIINLRMQWRLNYLHIKPINFQIRRQKLPTIPNKNIMDSAATMDNPAPDNDASVKSLGIFLQTEKNKWLK